MRKKKKDIDFFSLNKRKLRNNFIAAFKYLISCYSAQGARLFLDKHSYRM